MRLVPRRLAQSPVGMPLRMQFAGFRVGPEAAAEHHQGGRPDQRLQPRQDGGGVAVIQFDGQRQPFGDVAGLGGAGMAEGAAGGRTEYRRRG